jgi:heme oxygenase (mycobilin-producing)
MIKVFIERQVSNNNFSRVMDYLRDIRSAAVRQPGFVTAETLVKGENPIDILAISTWISENHWTAWQTSQCRLEIEDHVSHLLLKEPRISIYKIPMDED